jgi:hypothetical protein
MPVRTSDPIKLAEPFMHQCASCDAGLPMSCTCPTEDYRPAMLGLIREVERLRRIESAANVFVNGDHSEDGNFSRLVRALGDLPDDQDGAITRPSLTEGGADRG